MNNLTVEKDLIQIEELFRKKIGWRVSNPITRGLKLHFSTLSPTNNRHRNIIELFLP